MKQKELQIIIKAYNLIKKDWGPSTKCKDYALGCLQCQMGDFLKQYKSLIEFVYDLEERKVENEK